MLSALSSPLEALCTVSNINASECMIIGSTGPVNSVLLCNYIYWVKLYTQHSLKSQAFTLNHCHCTCEMLQKWSEGYDNHCRTKNLTWSSIMTNKNFCKQNFCNDYVIWIPREFSTTKIWSHTLYNPLSTLDYNTQLWPALQISAICGQITASYIFAIIFRWYNVLSHFCKLQKKAH